jgi:hypothetical protein
MSLVIPVLRSEFPKTDGPLEEKGFKMSQFPKKS